jgi:DNA-binding transcriptional ArsR family regulator
MPPRKPSVLLRSPAKIRALASPVRQEIVDTLESAGGEATVAEIAAQMGRHADGLYYHLKQLTKHGLVVELGDAGDGAGVRYRTAAPSGARMSLRYTSGKDSNVEPVIGVVGGLLRTARKNFDSALRSGTAVVAGSQRDLWAARVKGWVGDEDVAELNRLLERVNALLHKSRSPSRKRLVAAAWVIAPLKSQSLRRGKPEQAS